MNPTHNTAIYDNNPDLSNKSRKLAETLKIPWLPKAEKKPIHYRYLLFFQDNHLSLWTQDFPQFSPFYVDFLSGKLGYRLQNTTNKQLPLAKAIGLNKHKKPNPLTILDLTAGFGQDASLLACSGCSVTLLEKHPIVFALLQDGIKRAQSKQPDIFNRLNALEIDALTYCQRLENDPTLTKPDVVYYDPMFPVKTKSAANQKPMQLLQSLVGDDHNMETLFLLAKKIATQRLIVKRPNRAQPVFNSMPDTMIAMVKHRFDMYFPDSSSAHIVRDQQ